MTVQLEERLASLCNRMKTKGLVDVEIQEVMDAFQSFYSIWDSSLQGSWSTVYLLFEYMNCLNIQTHKYAALVLWYDSKALIDAHSAE